MTKPFFSRHRVTMLQVPLTIATLYAVPPAISQAVTGDPLTINQPAQRITAFDITAPSPAGFAGPGVSLNTAAYRAANGISDSDPTGAFGRGPGNAVRQVATSLITGNQRLQGLPLATLGLMTIGSQRGLPSTSMDSFVFNAGGAAEAIYGDEGDEGPPPYFGFTEAHRIETGINEGRLTTGHRSNLPDAWGWPQ